MDEILTVGVIQCFCNRQQQLHCFLPGHGFSKPLFECPTRQEVHHKIRNTILFPKIVDVDNVWMCQACQGLCFALETLEDVLKHGRGELVDPDDLDGNLPFQAGVVGFVDSCHPALSQLLEDVIATKVLTSQIRHTYSPLPRKKAAFYIGQVKEVLVLSDVKLQKDFQASAVNHPYYASFILQRQYG